MFCGAFYYQQVCPSYSFYARIFASQFMRYTDSSFGSAFSTRSTKKRCRHEISVDALSNVLLIYILRHAIQENLITGGVLLALQDKRLNAVLGAILQRPQEDWRIEQLADLSAMSRANFIRVFQQQLGMSPGAFYYSSAVTIGSVFY